MVRAASLETGLHDGLNKGFEGDKFSPSGSSTDTGLGGFAGAYVENIFQENRVVTLELKAEKASESTPQDLVLATESTPPAAPPQPPQESKAAWYCSKIKLPFVQIASQAPAPDRHLYMVLLLHRYQDLLPPKVWVNGIEAPVRFFRYARVDAGCYYVDGTEAELHSDENTISVFLSAREKKDR